jgi:hypothetical protein
MTARLDQVAPGSTPPPPPVERRRAPDSSEEELDVPEFMPRWEEQ